MSVAFLILWLRSLDFALATTHSNVRVFLVSAKYCLRAVWQDDQRRIIASAKERGLYSLSLLREYFCCWWYVFIFLSDLLFDEEISGNIKARTANSR